MLIKAGQSYIIALPLEGRVLKEGDWGVRARGA